MDRTIGRRDFMRTAGLSAGVVMAAGHSAKARAATNKIRVGSIGTGGQGSFHLRDGLARAESCEVVAVCDIYLPHLEGGWKNAGGEQRKVAKYTNYHEMLDKEELDAVVIATPLHTHYQIVLDCLDAGKYVFCEKTLCYEIEDCRDIVKKCHETGLFCQVGHQRRYNPKYNKAKWLTVERGLVGRINHMTAQWHRNNHWRRFVDHSRELTPEEKKVIPDLERHLNWRLYKESSGGLMTELCTHQIDIVQWFLGTPPSRVFGTGGIDYWRDGREVPDNIALVYEYDVKPGDAGFQAIQRRTRYQKKTRINRPYTVRCTYTSTTSTGKRGASELIQGDRGSFELTEKDCFIFGEPAIKLEEEQKKQAMNAKKAAEAVTSGKSLGLPNDAYTKGYPIEVFNDKSVDQLQFEAFGNDVINKGTPKANEMVGLYAAISGLAGLKAIRDGGTVVDIDPAWYTFDFETPDPYRFENWEGPDTPTGETATQGAPAEAVPAEETTA